jgi:hypothetical protein
VSDHDSFDKLIADMRGDSPDVPPEAHDWAADQMNAYADRLEALLAELEPVLLPTFGSVGVQPGDDPPIYSEVLGSEPVPGSDWVVVDPVTGDGSRDAT